MIGHFFLMNNAAYHKCILYNVLLTIHDNKHFVLPVKNKLFFCTENIFIYV